MNKCPFGDCLGRRESFSAPVKWLSYKQVDQNVRQLGSGLVHLCEMADLPKEERINVGLYASNSPEWVCVYIACHAYGLVTVPLYETLGTEGLKHICQQSEPVIVVCDKPSAARNLLSWCTSETKYVVVMHDGEEFVKLRSNDGRIMGYNDLCALGKQYSREPKQSSKEDLAMIRYTSGSVGLPKGVLCSHKNYINSIVCALQALEIGAGSYKNLTTELHSFTHLAYLPLAHAFEQTDIALALYLGARIGFLTKDITGFSKDLQTYKPDVLGAVPRILMRAHSAAMEKIGRYTVIRWLVNYAIRERLAEQSIGFYRRNGLVDYFLFRHVREKFGGRIRFVACGSAPLSKEVLDFTRAAFSCPVIEGYGSTEVGGLMSATLPCETNAGLAGAVYSSFSVRLTDVPEMGIKASRDKMGEICAKGDSCTAGYYKDEEKTRELIDADGFLHTGDIGTWTDEGSLKIVDRCKNIFKLAQGEYVSPRKIEELYSSSSLIANIYVEGNSLSTFIVAVIEPNLDALRERLTAFISRSDSTGSPEAFEKAKRRTSIMSEGEICNNKTANKIVLNELTQIGRNGGLKGFEQVKAIHLTTDHFTIENGMLTPTLKLSRPNVRRYFADVIKKLYEDNQL
ncbi:unnamed protein product [Calicophoron daubneyi]|uniref:long-chain-fatty-acid--CoA ligase n=1 Tax=Calicophoron daubneyi TaxID=300641 RepID=A0AAV2TYA6_CALDB